MNDKSEFNPQTFAVVGAGPVGCIVAAFLAQGGYEVILCDVIPDLLAPAMDPGIIIEGAENLQQKVSRTITNIDDLAAHDPDVIIITVKAHVLPLIASAIEGFARDGMYVVSWQNGIDTELELSSMIRLSPRPSTLLCVHMPISSSLLPDGVTMNISLSPSLCSTP